VCLAFRDANTRRYPSAGRLIALNKHERETRSAASPERFAARIDRTCASALLYPSLPRERERENVLRIIMKRESITSSLFQSFARASAAPSLFLDHLRSRQFSAHVHVVRYVCTFVYARACVSMCVITHACELDECRNIIEAGLIHRNAAPKVANVGSAKLTNPPPPAIITAVHVTSTMVYERCSPGSYTARVISRNAYAV